MRLWIALLQAVARETRRAGQTALSVTSSHGRSRPVRRALARLVDFLRTLDQSAEQLTVVERWCRILSRALIKDLHGREIKPPGCFLPA